MKKNIQEITFFFLEEKIIIIIIIVRISKLGEMVGDGPDESRSANNDENVRSIEREKKKIKEFSFIFFS
jgi:hypothetical protein